MNNDMLGIIMAGNSGLELGELTKYRPVGAVPLAARYRLVDFILSNMVNSGVDRVGIPTQTHYRSLMDHLGSGAPWDLNRKRHGLVVLPPYVSNGGELIGDLDVLNGIVDYINASQRKYVLITGGNILCKADYNKMFEQHLATGADITVMYHTMDDCSELKHHVGLKTNDDGRIVDLEVDPARPFSNQISMGTYLMEREFLEYVISRCLSRAQHDLVKDVLLHELNSLKIYGFEYRGYVKHIQSITSYYQCNMDMLDPAVSAELFDEISNPVYTKVKDQVPTIYGETCSVKNSVVADGCIINGTVENSVIFRGVQVEEGAVIRNSVVMQNSLVQSGVTLDHAIIDKAVIIRKNKTLMGQENYPVVVGKNAVV